MHCGGTSNVDLVLIWSELEIQFMIEKGLPSINYVTDGQLLSWVENYLSLTTFRKEFVVEYYKHPERFVMVDEKIVTYLKDHLEDQK